MSLLAMTLTSYQVQPMVVTSAPSYTLNPKFIINRTIFLQGDAKHRATRDAINC